MTWKEQWIDMDSACQLFDSSQLLNHFLLLHFNTFVEANTFVAFSDPFGEPIYCSFWFQPIWNILVKMGIFPK